ncbi:MAG: hypothetical protein K9G64_02360 [Bacteroidia bacterium]|nr:hypothetical protein [Bacteroidia bacterium]
MKINNYVTILFLFTINICFGQNKIRPAGKYIIGDTIIEVKVYKEDNEIREFREIKGTEIEFYNLYDLNTKILREEGKFYKRYWSGLSKFYNAEGKLEKIINYDNNTKTLFNKKKEPYDDVFAEIKRKSDSLLIEKYGFYFFNNYIIQNTNQSYYYGSGNSDSWFEVPNFKPNEFLMRYDIKLKDGERFLVFDFELDGNGQLKPKNTIKTFSNFKNNILLTIKSADSIALLNGLTEKDKPFSYEFDCITDSLHKSRCNLEFSITGKPFERKDNGSEFTEYCYKINVNPFTMEFISKDIIEILWNVCH